MTRVLCGKLLLLITMVLLVCLLSACSGSGRDSALPTQVEIDLEQQLRELEALPLPEGVDSTLWAELKQSMALLLQEKNKAVQAAPGSDASAATLLIDPEALEASWLYHNQGDYDQNGEVNISDITPIAQNFGESNEGNPFPIASALSVVDGDGNGEINIADLTPIGLNFGVRVGSYNLYTSASADDYPAGNGAANGEGSEFVGSVQLAMASGEPAEIRLALSFALPEPPPAGFLWLRPCDTPDGTGQLGTPSNLHDPLDLNEPPVAVLRTYSPTIFSQPPAFMFFIVEDSHDPDGSIVSYEFDFDGDGVYDQNLATVADGVEHTYGSSGLFRATLRVTDDEGAVDTDELQVSVNTPGNAPPTAMLLADVTEGEAPLTVNFDASGSTDSDGSIASFDFDIDGVPGYEITGSSEPLQSHTFENGGAHACFLRLTDNSGAQAYGAVVITVAAGGNLVPLADLTADVTSGERPLAVSFDASGSLDTDGSVVKYHWDLGGDGGFDHTTTEPFFDCTFHTEGSHNVQVFAVDNDGGVSAPDGVEIELSDGWEVREVAQPSLARDIDMVISDIGGQDFEPLIAWTQYGNNNEFLYIRHGQGQATSFSLSTTVNDSSGNFDMELVGGLPAIAQHDSGLQYLRAQNAAGTAWEQPIEIEPFFGAGIQGLDLEIVAGRPAVASNANLSPTQYHRADDETGTAWSFSTLTGLDFIGLSPQLLATPGRPLITVTDGGDADLLLFPGTDEVGSDFGNRISIVPSNEQGWSTFSLEMLDGKPALVYSQYGNLYLLRAKDSAGTDWHEKQLLPGPQNGGSAGYPELRSISGLPGIAFQTVNDQLWYMEAEDPQGQSWKEPELVDANIDGFLLRYALASYLGRPAIAYCSINGNSVKFAYLRE